ncbi:intron-binding protein [Musa troglodytarum]|uniref:Intron-binding protein n=1 Tax=Musa troglodytarum TaxID=320322 RepID=A0A9E7LG73_9LILI|nr:intron-binding protein [Musa troglodytarum]
MILEVSRYSGNYLSLKFDPTTATSEYVMSMFFVVNEKFRENVAAWICFHDRKDSFRGGRALRIAEKTNYLLFRCPYPCFYNMLLRRVPIEVVILRFSRSSKPLG